MIEVGDTLKNSREVSGVTLEEVSLDLDIPLILLEQIEDGNIGAFKDIFELKEYIIKYSKYIGLDSDELIDMFNSYMFERTSKIPMDKIENAVNEKEKEEEKDNRIASPYTKAVPIFKTTPYIVGFIVASIVLVLAIIWSITQITITNATDCMILFK